MWTHCSLLIIRSHVSHFSVVSWLLLSVHLIYLSRLRNASRSRSNGQKQRQPQQPVDITVNSIHTSAASIRRTYSVGPDEPTRLDVMIHKLSLSNLHIDNRSYLAFQTVYCWLTRILHIAASSEHMSVFSAISKAADVKCTSQPLRSATSAAVETPLSIFLATVSIRLQHTRRTTSI